MSLSALNPQAEQISRDEALTVNTQAAKGLQNVLKSNLGPRGTLKMLVSGSGLIKLTKDGNTLLHEMQIQHPTAVLIARAATAADVTVGDGTTSTVLFTGELMKQAERYISEGLHPRVVVDGFEIAKQKTLALLEACRVEATTRDMLVEVAHTTLATKLRPELVKNLASVVTDAVLTIRTEDKPVDLHMVEVMHMQHRFDKDTRLIKGLVLDHGARHPAMPKSLENAYVLTLNVSLEFEKSEVSAGFYYKDAEQRQKMVESERKFTDDKVRKIIEFKRAVCTDKNGAPNGKSFLIISQKGIDPLSLDMLCKEGILALRRAKRRNMERLTLACGGSPVHSVEDLDAELEIKLQEEDSPDAVLGRAGKVHETTLGEDKYTFVEDVANPRSCTVLIKGQNPHTIAQIKDAIRDGLRSVKATLDDASVIPGAGAFELRAYHELLKVDVINEGAALKAGLGVRAFAEALLIIPKTLAANSGFDVQDALLRLQRESGDAPTPSDMIGLDIHTGECIKPQERGIFDSVLAKRSVITIATTLASQLLVVDEMVRGGVGSRPKDPNAEMM